jgi:hypothetical protein
MTKQYAETAFEDGANDISVMNFAGWYYSMRLYCQHSHEKWIPFEDVQTILTSKFVPERLTHMAEHTSIPKEEDLEKASEKIYGTTSDE